MRQVHSIERIAKDKKKGETEIRKRDTRDRRRDRCKAVQCGCFEFKKKMNGWIQGGMAAYLRPTHRWVCK